MPPLPADETRGITIHVRIKMLRNDQVRGWSPLKGEFLEFTRRLADMDQHTSGNFGAECWRTGFIPFITRVQFAHNLVLVRSETHTLQGHKIRMVQALQVSGGDCDNFVLLG